MSDYTFPGLIGKITRIDPFDSKYVVSRKVDIWTPQEYWDDKDQEFAVLYMNDGQNAFDPSLSRYSHTDWGIDETITRLRQEQRIRHTIVVAIWSTAHRVAEYMPQRLPENTLFERLQNTVRRYSGVSICSDGYLRFIVEELKPFVDTNYRTLPDPENTFIMGSSMGGLISLYAVCEYPRVFSGAACVSTHFPIGRGIVLKHMEEHLPDPANHKFYFDYGTRTVDSAYEKYQLRADEILQENGYKQGENWLTRKFVGHKHSETDWRKRVHVPLEFLLNKVMEG